MNTENTWKPDTERVVAYFDMLGFTELIIRQPHIDAVARLSELNEIIEEVIEKENEVYDLHKKKHGDFCFYQPIKSVRFSDSVVFITESATVQQVTGMSALCSDFFGRCIGKGIPIKGAIARGEFRADFENNTFCGRPLVDAYQLSEEIEFMGVAYHHSFEKKIEPTQQLPYLLQNQICMHRKIPLKQGGRLTHLIGNPFRFYEHSPEPLIEKYYKNFYHTCSGKIRKYAENTAEVYGFANKIMGESL
jgi:hypothetical protein